MNLELKIAGGLTLLDTDPSAAIWCIDLLAIIVVRKHLKGLPTTGLVLTCYGEADFDGDDAARGDKLHSEMNNNLPKRFSSTSYIDPT